MKKIFKFGILSMALAVLFGGLTAVIGSEKHPKAVNAESSLNVVKLEKGLFDKNNAMTVNQVTAPNRFSLNLFLRSDGLCDAPVTQIENNPSELSRVSAPYDTSMTKEQLYSKMSDLNIFQGYLEVDQVPVTKYSRSEIGFWDNPFGRCYLGKINGSTNQFQLHIDVCNTFADGKMHSVTLKKGALLPTFAYFTNLDTAMYTKDTVLEVPETIVWQINSSLTTTWIGTTSADKQMVSKVGFSEKGTNSIYENTTANRSMTYLDLVSYYSVYETNNFNSTHTYGDSAQDSQNFHIDYHDSQASDCRSGVHQAGGMLTLHFWDHVLIDDQPAYTDWNDSRVQHAFAGQTEKFGRIGLSFVFKSVSSCKEKDTFSLTLLKGIEIPTPLDRFEDRADFMTTDVTYKFTFKAIQSASVAGGQKSFDCTGCQTLDTEAWDANCQSTEVISAHMVQHSGDNSNGRLVFKLSNYDFNYTDENTVKDLIKNVNEEYQHPIVINQTAANYYSNILFDGVSCASKITNYKTVLGYHGVGFIANFPWNNPTVSRITIKAGTRFPAQEYCFPNPSAECEVSNTPKFFKTTSDVVLEYDAAQKRWTRLDVIKEVQPTAVKFSANASNSMQFCVHLDGADYSSTGARTVNAVMRKTDNMWTGIKFDGKAIVNSNWEGSSGTYDRSSRSTVNNGGIGYHQFQMVGDYTNPGINEIFIPAGTYFYSSAMLDQGAGVKEIYVTKSDVTFYKYKTATNFATAAEIAADEYATGFLTNIVCNNGVTAPSTTAWSQQANTYFSLTLDAKAIFENAVASSTGSNVEKCVERYDYIIAKYGTTNYPDFISRTGVSSVRQNISILNTNDIDNSGLILIVSFVIVAASVITANVIYKKNKSN